MRQIFCNPGGSALKYTQYLMQSKYFSRFKVYRGGKEGVAQRKAAEKKNGLDSRAQQEIQ